MELAFLRCTPFASPVLVVLFLVSPCFSQDALRLFRETQNALGGADKIVAIRDFQETEVAETWDDSGHVHGQVRKRTRWVRPSYLRLDQVGPDDTYVPYCDGRSGWEILPNKTVADLVGGELKFAQKYLRDFSLNFWLADRDSRYVITSPSSDVLVIADKDEHGASGSLKITLDSATLLPLKQTTISLADPSHPTGSETHFADRRSIEGVQFPRAISVFHNGHKLAQITVEQISVNRGIRPEEIAIKPTDLNPVMPLP
jgi:hypothetical protein